jgi:hypothetical protein
MEATMKKPLLALLFFILVRFSLPSAASAQFYKVYEYTTPDGGEVELVYWTTYIPSSSQKYDFYGESVVREGLVAHSLEVEYGLSHHWTVAAYVDFENPADAKLRRTNLKAVLARYRFFEKGSRPVDIAVYLEYILPTKGYKNSEEIEFKTILEKDFRDLTLSLNPTFEKKVSGEVEEGVEFNFAGGIYYKRSQFIQPGLEFYTRMGELAETRSFGEQKAVLFPTVDLFFKQYFHWHLGAGFGLSDNSDDVILKSIFSFEY